MQSEYCDGETCDCDDNQCSTCSSNTTTSTDSESDLDDDDFGCDTLDHYYRFYNANFNKQGCDQRTAAKMAPPASLTRRYNSGVKISYVDTLPLARTNPVPVKPKDGKENKEKKSLLKLGKKSRSKFKKDNCVLHSYRLINCSILKSPLFGFTFCTHTHTHTHMQYLKSFYVSFALDIKCARLKLSVLFVKLKSLIGSITNNQMPQMINRIYVLNFIKLLFDECSYSIFRVSRPTSLSNRDLFSCLWNNAISLFWMCRKGKNVFA
ncbi:hypothetical protein BpHYR1_043175 [Brachionus plicatilis]|uniref:Uncharacterized protein n=1 Tax=Brachionus plicatilis TaxID=10195 RepID=A0A3M7R9B0_BRAPC|nr:hypothetical protein BpHYR1_043175 [Brachionus plicatilis]